MNQEAWNTLIKAVLTILSILLTTYILPYIKQKIGESKYEKIQSFTELAVRTAEQIFTNEENAKKKEYVYNYILSKANELGVGMDEADVDLLVEGVVNLVKHDNR